MAPTTSSERRPAGPLHHASGIRRPLRRRIARFLSQPVSVRNATGVIVTATVATTALGGVTVWLVDRKDFPHLTDALWWSLQTVTTVGYGDVTPSNRVGRLVGSLVLMYAVAFMTILTATITTSFVKRAGEQQHNVEGLDRHEEMQLLIDRIEEIVDRIERLEQKN